MSGLILPNEWTSQPQYPVQIDWNSPLARGLSIVSIPSNGVINLANPRESFSPNFDSVIGRNGRAIATSTTKSYSLPNSPNNRANEFTAITLCNATATLGQFRAPFTKDWNSGASPSYVTFAIEYNQGGAGQNVLTAFTSTNTNYSRTSNYTIPDVRTPHLSGILRTASSVSAIFNGNIVATNTGISAVNYSGSGANDVWINSTYNKGDFNVYLALYWSRALSNAEIKSLSDNPWQIFKSQSRRIWVVGAGGGGDVSLSITGQLLTANLGALSASVTSSVTGNQTTLQQGTITANVSKTLTGQAISLVQGSVSSDVSTVITGQTVSLAQGSVTDASSGNVTKALSGQSLSVSQGALTASISLALNGQSIVLSGGSVSPAISSALAGQQSSVQQGTISANISAGLTGQAVVISNGTVAQAGSDVTKALTGQQLSIALGVLLEKKTIARPSSDTTAGAWLPSAGSSLYATLDEVSPDDADYIYTNSVSTCKIALNAVADPLTSSGQIVSYRVWSPNSDGLTVRLMQGATEIASWTHTVLPTSPTTYQQALTAGQCDAITDYSTLAIQLESV